VDQAQSSQVPESSGEVTLVGEITVLNFQKVGFSNRKESVFRKSFPGFLWEIGIQVRDFLASKRFIDGRDGPGGFQDAFQGGLKEIFHDDLFPIRTADPSGGLVPKGIDPARPLKALAAV
jgi:hypothetical protein